MSNFAKTLDASKSLHEKWGTVSPPQNKTLQKTGCLVYSPENWKSMVGSDVFPIEIFPF